MTSRRAARVLSRKKRRAAGTPLKRFLNASMPSNASWPAGKSRWAASGSIFTPSCRSLTDALFWLRPSGMQSRYHDCGQKNARDNRQRNVCADRIDPRQKHFHPNENQHAGDTVVQVFEHVEQRRKGKEERAQSENGKD